MGIKAPFRALLYKDGNLLHENKVKTAHMGLEMGEQETCSAHKKLLAHKANVFVSFSVNI